MNTDSHPRPPQYRSQTPRTPLSLVDGSLVDGSVVDGSVPSRDQVQHLRRDLRARVRDARTSANALRANSAAPDAAKALWAESEQLQRVLQQFERIIAEEGDGLSPMAPSRGALACEQMRSVGGLLELHVFRNTELQEQMLTVAELPGWSDTVSRWFESQADQIGTRNAQYEAHMLPRAAREEMRRGEDAPSLVSMAWTVILIGLAAMGVGGLAAAAGSAILYDGSVLPAAAFGALTGATSGLLIAGIAAGVPLAWRTRSESRRSGSELYPSPDDSSEQV